MKLTVTTAVTPTADQLGYIHQNIEASDTAKLEWGSPGAKPLTVGFWVKSSLTGAHSFSVNKGSPNINRSYLTTYTINASNTWEFKTITIPGDKSTTWSTAPGTIGIELHWNLAVGSTYRDSSSNSWVDGRFYSTTGVQNVSAVLGSTWQMTLVRAEIGEQVYGYDRVPYLEELKRCQRYYAKTLPVTTAPADFITSDGALALTAPASTTALGAKTHWRFPVEMQRTPNETLLASGTSSSVGVSARYWRYQTSTGASHFPRYSRIGFGTASGDTNIVVITGDNCSDSGSIDNATYSYDFGSPVAVLSSYFYSTYGAGERSGTATISYSNDNVNWSVLTSHPASNGSSCGLKRTTEQTTGTATAALMRAANNGTSLATSVLNVNEKSVQIANNATTAAAVTRYEVHVIADAEI